MGMIGDGLEIIKLVNMGANADVHEKLGKFVDKAQELQAKVEALEAETKDLREQLRFKGTVIRLKSHVYVEGDDEPICSRCADVENRAVHLTIHRDPKMGSIVVCPHCKSQTRRLILRSQLGTE